MCLLRELNEWLVVSMCLADHRAKWAPRQTVSCVHPDHLAMWHSQVAGTDPEHGAPAWGPSGPGGWALLRGKRARMVRAARRDASVKISDACFLMDKSIRHNLGSLLWFHPLLALLPRSLFAWSHLVVSEHAHGLYTRLHGDHS